jgi:epoxyqueuosine reductase QueG
MIKTIVSILLVTVLISCHKKAFVPTTKPNARFSMVVRTKCLECNENFIPIMKDGIYNLVTCCDLCKKKKDER